MPRYAATIQYCQPYIRPLENLILGVDMRKALNGDIPSKIVDMMGYRSAIPFFGYGKSEQFLDEGAQLIIGCS